jgi:uncharacterized protein (TIGR02270 family)
MLPHLIAAHATDAAFYRARLVDGALSSTADLRSLGRFDHLLRANLEGLRVADAQSTPPQAGYAAAQARLERWQAADEAFVCAVLAFEQAPLPPSALPPRLVALAQAACAQHAQAAVDTPSRLTTMPPLGQGLVMAGEWLPWPRVQPAVFDWAAGSEPVLRCAALSLCVMHRVPAGDALPVWLAESHPLVRGRALLAVGELGQADLAGPLVDALQDTDLHCRRQAAAALALLGRGDGVAVLGAWVSDMQAAAESAADTGTARQLRREVRHGVALLAQVLDPSQHQHVLAAALASPQHRRSGLELLRFTGDANAAEWLLSLCEAEMQPAALQAAGLERGRNLARLAGDVFAHLTGAALSQDGRWAPEPDLDDAAADLAGDPQVPAVRKQDLDEDMLWPDVAALKRWWHEHAARFEGGRHLAGHPLTSANAVQVLVDPQATQLQRHHAALFLRANGATPQLFDVRAPLGCQRGLMAGLGLV